MSKIDYITASIPYDVWDLEKLPLHEAFAAAGQGQKVKRYDFSYYLANGALIAVPSKANARQKVLFQMTGESLAMNRTLGVEDTKLLHWLMVEQRAKFSRLDVAFDTVDPTSWPERLLWEWRWKQCKTRIRDEPRTWKKEGGGETIYFGSETSLRQLRTYDKAADLQLLAGIITRVELQNRDDMAQHLAGLIVRNNELDWTTAAACKELIDFPNVKWYQEMMESGGVKNEVLGRKKTDWQTWFHEEIMSLMVNKYLEDQNGARLFLRREINHALQKFDDIENQLKGWRATKSK